MWLQVQHLESLLSLKDLLQIPPMEQQRLQVEEVAVHLAVANEAHDVE